ANAKITETETTRQSIINTINNLVSQFNALAPAESTNAEVQLARKDINGKEYASLQERLLADNKQQNIMYSDVSGTYISSDSVDGWVKDVVIEGNTYQNPSVLSEISSTGNELEDGRFEIPLLCRNKNIFDGELEIGSINSTTGNLDINSAYLRTKNYQYISSNAEYVLSRTRNVAYIGLRFYDINKTFISSLALSGLAPTFTTPANCRYFKFVILENISDVIQVEKGTVVTSYEIPQSHKLTILSDVQLEKIGTVADRIVEKDGVWGIEDNNKDVVFNGSENWYLHSDLTDRILFRLIGNQVSDGLSDVKAISNIFTNDNTAGLLNYLNSFRLTNYNSVVTVFVCIEKSKMVTQDLNGFKDFLSKNNMLIKYPTTASVFYPLADDQQVALRTFTNKTNILSLCEIEPTIKGSVPKSTSASINSINTRLDSVNESLDKVKKLEDATMTSVISDKSFTVIEDTANGYLSDLKLEGRTLNQIVKNGNFANGTTSWTSVYGTNTVSNGVLSNTGVGTGNSPIAEPIYSVTVNPLSKYYFKARVRVTNSSCQSIIVRYDGTTTGTDKDVYSISSPVQNQWYDISVIATPPTDATGNLRTLLRHQYIDATTANGKVMEVQNVMTLDLTALG
ncbi:hypothetical protein, partial [Romboutsia sp.]|uniref:hypothetical protein n=1 Tax=Romboutsia sp. TaxID=1965302 RepID=UPI002C1D34E3